MPITLETANPTFGLDIPVLPAWNLTLEDSVRYNSFSMAMPTGGARMRGTVKRKRSLAIDHDDEDELCAEHQVSQVTSTGSVHATFRIPGQTTIPSDDDEHSVTIADLKLDAKVTWVCVPKVDTRVHLEVCSQNIAFQYFLVFCPFFHRPTSRILQVTLSFLAPATYTSIEVSSHDQIFILFS